MARPVVSILMGSGSDLETMSETARVLERFAVPYELKVLSAHRSPEKASRYARSAASRGLRVIIAGAGGAAHLAGVMAAGTTLPVIGVPLSSSSLLGLDALLATVQMPAGIPVATVAVGRAGATNAGLLAVQILATSSAPLRRRLDAFKREMSRKVADQSSRASRDLRRLIGSAR